MKRNPVTEQDLAQAWDEMSAAFRSTHPLPQPPTWHDGQAWSAKVRRDCNAVIVPILEAATADLARGDVANAKIITNEIRPFQRLKRVLDAVEAQQKVSA